MRSWLAIFLVLSTATVAHAFYDYEHISQMYTTGQLVDVAFHPGGDYALVLESSGKILKVGAADWSVSQVADLSDVYLNHLDFRPDGTGALIVGRYLHNDTDEGRVYWWDHELQAVELIDACTEPGIELRAVEFVPDGISAVIVGWYQINSSGGVLYAYDYDPVSRTTSIGGAANFWGPCDVSWRPDAQEALITICENDAEVVAYRPPAPYENRLLSTDYRNKGSNALGVDHHPAEGYGVLVDISQNTLKYNGVWTRVDLPGSSLADIAFNTDGSRALLVGRARSVNATDKVGTVQEFLGDRGTFTPSDFRDVSIPGFESPPWQAESNTYLHGVAFRPGLCEGLMVGGHGTMSSKFAPIAHFTDLRGADCLQAQQDGGLDGGDTGEPDAGVDAGVDAGLDAGGDTGGSTVIPCSSDEECPAGQYCSGDRCTSDCESNADCMAPYVCNSRGRCVPPDTDGGTDAGPSDGGDPGSDPGAVTDAGGDPGTGSDGSSCDSCRYDSECPSRRYCRDGCCVFDCTIDTDCPHDFYCGERGRCLALPGQTSSCGCAQERHERIPLGVFLLLLAGMILTRRRFRS